MDDFWRLFARYRVILTIAVLVGGGVALLFALTRATNYNATATLSFKDLSQVEGLVGQAPNSTQAPAQQAETSLRSVTTDPVLRQALSSLPGEGPISELRDHVSASIDPASDLLLVGGQSSSAKRAAAIANAVASVTAARTNARTRASFAGYAQTLQQKIDTIPNTPANKTTRQQDETNLSRLQTLSIVARPAQIEQQADVPTHAASGHLAFDVLLGAVLGLILGAGVAFVREALDRSIHSPDDVSRDLELPIVGHVDEELLGSSPFLSAADTPATRNGLARFGIIRRGVELLGGESREGGEGGTHIVLVTSPGPSEGKTTVALSLACAFASAGRSTLLLEADLRRPVLAQRLGLSGDRGLADRLRSDHADGIVQSLELPATGGVRLDVTLAGRQISGSAEALASHAFADALRELAADHDVVIIDGPPLIPVADALEIIPLVDAYLVCLRAGQTKLAQLSATRRLLERLPSRPGAAVVTGIAQGRYQLEGYDGYYRDTA